MTKAKRGELGVCVVAAGEIGQVYLRSWTQAEDIRIVSVADIDAERAEKAAEEYAAPACETDYKKAIDQEGVDIVTVCTPTMLHPEVSIYAAERGKHVLCVKPIALTLADANRMIEAAEQNDVSLCVGFMRRYTPTTKDVIEAVQDGTMRRPALYRVEMGNRIRPKILMHDQHGNGGPLIDMCCHYIDIARVYFASDPAKVFARGMVLAKGRQELEAIKDLAIDTASVVVTYESGDILTMNVCWGLPPNHGGAANEVILAPGGSIEGLGFAPTELCIHTDTKKQTITWEKDQAVQRSFDLLVDDFVRCIRSGRPASVTGADGVKALEVSLAALESIETGRVVDVG